MTCKKNQPGTRMQYIFLQIFGKESTQEDVSIEIYFELLPGFIAGRDMLLCSYGVSNSGKTHMIFKTNKDPGILSRCLGVIFDTVKSKLYKGQEIKLKKYCKVYYTVVPEKFDIKNISSKVPPDEN